MPLIIRSLCPIISGRESVDLSLSSGAAQSRYQYHVIAADLRNAKGGQSTGPLEVDRPWDAFTDDHIGLMDHLGIRQFMVLGFCIGGPFIRNLLKRAGDRVVAAVPA